MIVETLAAAGTFLAGTSAWAAFLSPRAKAVRDAKAEAAQLQAEAARRGLAVYEALFGAPEVREGGAVIVPAKNGLVSDMTAVMAKLEAPILNGKGANLITTVDRVDRRTRALARRVSIIEKHVTP